MGSVWRAEHVELGTLAAVKLIHLEGRDRGGALARFRREALAAASLSSPHVVRILDYGVEERGPYLVMELLQGESLRQRLTRVGTLEPRQVAQVLAQVGDGVAEAHQAGIVHRDLKPANIFLARDGDDERAKVLDFGVAKLIAPRGEDVSLKTDTGALLGTPAYMSPEQAAGKGVIDPRSDVWALGVIAFECLVGFRPFDAETVGGVVLAICSDPVPVPSRLASVPAGFDEWFLRATERDLNRRFGSMREAISALSLVCNVDLSPGERRGERVSRRAPLPEASGSASGLTAATASLAPNGDERRRWRPGWLMLTAGSVLVASLSAGWFSAQQAPVSPVAAGVSGESTPLLDLDRSVPSPHAEVPAVAGGVSGPPPAKVSAAGTRSAEAVAVASSSPRPPKRTAALERPEIGRDGTARGAPSAAASTPTSASAERSRYEERVGF